MNSCYPVCAESLKQLSDLRTIYGNNKNPKGTTDMALLTNPISVERWLSRHIPGYPCGSSFPHPSSSGMWDTASCGTFVYEKPRGSSFSWFCFVRPRSMRVRIVFPSNILIRLKRYIGRWSTLVLETLFNISRGGKYCVFVTTLLKRLIDRSILQVDSLLSWGWIASNQVPGIWLTCVAGWERIHKCPMFVVFFLSTWLLLLMRIITGSCVERRRDLDESCIRISCPRCWMAGCASDWL